MNIETHPLEVKNVKDHPEFFRAEVFTVGHSTRSIEEFVRLLRIYGIRRLVDVRTIPRSRHNPQFSHEALSRALHGRRLHYRHLKALGGLRHVQVNSPNAGWRNASFRAFADYMQTPAFAQALEELIGLAATERTVIMCAEAVPWRCHRSLIADALTVRGTAVRHVFSPTQSKPHTLTPFARVRGLQVTYPGGNAS
ncbi:MAG: DUF488 domain-containing protein [Acidobacteriota bacterium]|jgi:uncharacterized protein (DUF488 family)